MAPSKKLAIQLETVDALIAEFRKRWDFEEDDEKMIEDFKASLGKKEKKISGSDSDAPPKKKRQPSAYNMFVSEKWDELTAAGFSGKERIREAARMWNKIKADTAAPADDANDKE
jgi:hypothetical protein